MNQNQNERVKRIEWVSSVVGVAIMSAAISQDSSRVCSSSSRLASKESCERSEPATSTLVATSSLRLLACFARWIVFIKACERREL